MGGQNSVNNRCRIAKHFRPKWNRSCAYFIGTSSHCVFSNTIQNLPCSGPRTRSRWGIRTVCGLALDYLSKMKIAVMLRQLDRGHILWCGRVVRVERAHRVRVVRSVQKMPDVGNGVIGFDHVRFHVRDLVMAFLEDELVRCCVTHHRARDIEVWRSRSMSPARVTRQRRQSRRIVWDDRERMRVVVISELEAIRLVYVSLRMGRVSSIGPNVRMAAVVISEL